MIEKIIEKVESANQNFGEYVHTTPLEYNTTLSKLAKNKIYLKLENFQKTGSFKIRGAFNKISKLSDKEKKSGVICASAGNHGQGVALAATDNGISSTVVIPEGTPIIKAEAIKNYGAKVVVHGKDFDEAYQHARKLKDKEGFTFIHAFNDPEIIIGQGTIGLEILQQLPDVDIIMVPIGGGGLISGIASYCKAKKPEVKIIGVEAAGSPSMLESIKKGKLVELKKIDTIAEGIAIKRPGEITFKIIQELVDDIVLVDDNEIANAILLLMERAKIVAEGAGVVALAAALYRLKERNKKVITVISGGNIDTTLINRIIIKGLIKAGRFLKFSTQLIDKPGSLMELLKVIARLKGNIITIEHDRRRLDVPLKQTIVEIEMETRNEEHIEQIKKELDKNGYKIQEIEL